MAARSSSPLIAVLAVTVLAALGGVAWLLMDDGGGVVSDLPAESVVEEPTGEPAMELSPVAREARAVPEVVDVPQAEEPVEAPAAETRGPVRAVSGRLVRRVDESALVDVRVRSRDQAVVTDEEGAFALTAVGEDETLLTVSLPGQEVVVPLPDGPGDLSGLRFVLDTGWMVSGVLYSSAGGVVPGGQVRAPNGEWVDAAPDGSFVLRDVLADSNDRPGVTLSARGQWHALHEERIGLPAAARVAGGVELTLQGAGSLRGTLTSTHREMPLVDEVRLAWRRQDTGLAPVKPALRVEPDETSAYHLENVPAGTYIVEVLGPNLERASERMEAATARALHARARGLGSPESMQAEQDMARAELLEEVARLWVEDPSSPPAVWIPGVEVRVGETTTLDIEVPAGAVVAGRVTDGAGNPLAGARVEALRVLSWENPEAGNTSSVSVWTGGRTTAERGEDGVHRTRFVSDLGDTASDAAGEYVLGQLPGGDVLLRVTGPDSGSRPVDVELVLEAGERREGVDVALAAGLGIEGRLVDPAGAPVEGRVALVAVDGPVAITGDDQIATDAQGRFAFTGLAPEPRRLWVSAPGYLGVSEVVEPGGAPLVLELEPAPLLSGVVRDAFTYEPVTSFQVSVSTLRSMTRQTFQTEDGRFVFNSLSDQDYDLEVTAPGYEASKVEGVRPGFDVPEIEVLLTPGG